MASSIDMEFVCALQFHMGTFERGTVGKDEVSIAQDVEHSVLCVGLHNIVAIVETYPVLGMVAFKHGSILSVGGGYYL